MAIKKTGPIDFQDIIDEFGGTDEAKLSEYYKGGRVPFSPLNANVPTSGAISLSDFYGATNVVSVTLMIQGGGGGGGNGFADGSGSGTAPSGEMSGVMSEESYNAVLAANGGQWPTTGATTASFLLASEMGYPASAGSLRLRALGGGGGSIASNNGTTTGTAGGSTSFGAGGAGGGANAAGSSSPYTSWGAGGGGGGGDNGSGSYFGYGGDDPGEAGTGGGSRGAVRLLPLTFIPGQNYYFQLGGAGANGTGGNYDGGYGSPGAILINVGSGSTEAATFAASDTSGDFSLFVDTNVFPDTTANRVKCYVYKVVFDGEAVPTITLVQNR